MLVEEYDQAGDEMSVAAEAVSGGIMTEKPLHRHGHVAHDVTAAPRDGWAATSGEGARSWDWEWEWSRDRSGSVGGRREMRM